MKYTWLVERYLEGELSGEELRRFELQILKEPEVAEELERIRALQKFAREQHARMKNSVSLVEDFDDLDNIIQEQEISEHLDDLKVHKISSVNKDIQDIKTRLTELHAEERLTRLNSNKVLVRKVSLWLAGSAMALLVLVSTLLMIGSNSSYEELYAEYYYPRLADVPRTTSTLAEDPVAVAMNFYVDKDFAVAYPLLSALPANLVTNELVLYTGNAAMEVGKYRDAIKYFNQLDNDPLWKQEAMWYKSLCYMIIGDGQAARYELQAIIDENGYHKGQAASLIRKL
jgi:hypothetical protein